MSEVRKADIRIGIELRKSKKKVYNVIELFHSSQWGFDDGIDERYRLRLNYKWHGGQHRDKQFFSIKEIGDIIGINIGYMVTGSVK